jgi:hypothetical protein
MKEHHVLYRDHVANHWLPETTVAACRAHGFEKINNAFVILLPKKQDACEVRDFRPISLVHGVAKLIAKTMSLRLAPILPTLVTPNQSAFIRGRSILDNYMLVQFLANM